MQSQISVGVLLLLAAVVVTAGLIAAVLARRGNASYAKRPATVVYAPAPTPVSRYFVPDPPVLPTAEPPRTGLRFGTEAIDQMQGELDDDYENAITKISVSPKASMAPVELAPFSPPEPMPRGRTPRATEPEPTSPFRLETRADEPSVITSAPRPDRRY
jgi:hypothetical protein